MGCIQCDLYKEARGQFFRQSKETAKLVVVLPDADNLKSDTAYIKRWSEELNVNSDDIYVTSLLKCQGIESASDESYEECYEVNLIPEIVEMDSVFTVLLMESKTVSVVLNDEKIKVSSMGTKYIEKGEYKFFVSPAIASLKHAGS